MRDGAPGHCPRASLARHIELDRRVDTPWGPIEITLRAVAEEPKDQASIAGLFSDEPEPMDEVSNSAMAAKERHRGWTHPAYSHAAVTMKRPQSKACAPFLRRVTVLSEKADPSRHPFNIEALRGLDLELGSRVTFFVGENGSGKSTLLEAVAQCCGFNGQGGGRDHQVQTRDNRDDLAGALRLSWLPKATDGFFMRAESFFNFASYIDQVSTLQRYGGRRLHEQSHGESFLALFLNRFDRGIYILDEPEAALSPQRQLAFLKVIHDLEATDQAQFLIASHSPILLAYPNATLLSLDGGPIHEVAYADTAHYKLTKEFLDSPDRFLKHLLASGVGDEPDPPE